VSHFDNGRIESFISAEIVILSVEEKVLDVADWILLTIGIFVASILSINFLKFRSTMAKHRNRLASIPSQVYTSKTGDIEYLLKGDGTTILVSHGITGGVDQGMGLSNDYLGDGYRLLLVSRFGYLKSVMPDNATPELQSEAYKELLDYLGIESAFIFGNSAGGTSAIHFAIKHPKTCRGLILVSSNAPLDTSTGHPPKFVFKSNFLYWFAMKLIGKRLLKMFLPKGVINNLSKQEMNRIINGIYFSALPITKRTKGILFDLFVSNPSINNELPFDRISSPVLIINSIDDPSTLIEGAKTLASRIRTSSLLTFDTGGHLILGHEQEIKQKVNEFISQNS
jgi:pimeloyl-ACP methyl ester carboxylesterase